MPIDISSSRLTLRQIVECLGEMRVPRRSDPPRDPVPALSALTKARLLAISLAAANGGSLRGYSSR